MSKRRKPHKIHVGESQAPGRDDRGVETARGTLGQCPRAGAGEGFVTDLGGTDDAYLCEPEQILLLFKQSKHR